MIYINDYDMISDVEMQRGQIIFKLNQFSQNKDNTMRPNASVKKSIV